MSMIRIALVTGANKGVGKQVVRELVANGVNVLLLLWRTLLGQL
jgi:NAD(P)-dependent dehydrogenase (short-subunit alcohol dehydrogenase family)